MSGRSVSSAVPTSSSSRPRACSAALWAASIWTRTAACATLGLPEPALRGLAAKAGSAPVRLVEMDNPFNSLYELAG
jgi:hypothetical protein